MKLVEFVHSFGNIGDLDAINVLYKETVFRYDLSGAFWKREIGNMLDRFRESEIEAYFFTMNHSLMRVNINLKEGETMTTEMIKKLCGDILIYIDKSAESLPSSADLSVTAIRDTVISIYEDPDKSLEYSESLFKMIDGLYEMAKHYVYYDESGLFTARDFASRLYDELREMRP